jgi:hypothetical protein
MSLKSLKIVKKSSHYWKKPPYFFKCFKKASQYFEKASNSLKISLESLAIYKKPHECGETIGNRQAERRAGLMTPTEHIFFKTCSNNNLSLLIIQVFCRKKWFKHLSCSYLILVNIKSVK